MNPNNGGFFSGLTLDGLIKTGASVYLSTQTDKATNQTAPNKVAVETPRSEAAREDTKKNDIMKYAVIGVGGLAVLGVVVFLATRGKKG